VLALTLTTASAGSCESSTPANSDAALAAKDGSAAGRWFLQMISNGDFSKQEQEQIRAILPGYYGLRIYWHRPKGLHSFRGDFAYASMDGLRELAAYFRQKDSLKPERIEFWAEPTPEVREAAKKRARDAAMRIAAKIMALKCTAYPELNRFDLLSIHLGDGGFWYAPNKPEAHNKFGKPTIGITIGPPCLVMTQISFPRVLFPKQCLEVTRILGVENAQLKAEITANVLSEIKPLIAAERSLGGEPTGDGCDPFMSVPEMLGLPSRTDVVPLPRASTPDCADFARQFTGKR
jgi:hypothetical protein